MEFLLQILMQLGVINDQLVTLSLVIYDYLQFLPRFLLAGAVVGLEIGPMVDRFIQLWRAKIWHPRYFFETYAKMVLLSIVEINPQSWGKGFLPYKVAHP